jgi:hypothetical protein
VPPQHTSPRSHLPESNSMLIQITDEAKGSRPRLAGVIDRRQDESHPPDVKVAQISTPTTIAAREE